MQYVSVFHGEMFLSSQVLHSVVFKWNPATQKSNVPFVVAVSTMHWCRAVLCLTKHNHKHSHLTVTARFWKHPMKCLQCRVSFRVKCAEASRGRGQCVMIMTELSMLILAHHGSHHARLGCRWMCLGEGWGLQCFCKLNCACFLSLCVV